LRVGLGREPAGAVEVQPLLLFEVQRPRAAAAEDRQLMARLVHRAIAIEPA